MELPVVLRQAKVTSREAEVLEALGAHLTNAEIAERFVISVRTVESHVSALLSKLEVPDRRALARVAQEVRRERMANPVRFPRTLGDVLAATRAGSRSAGRAKEQARLRAMVELVAAHGGRRLAVIAGDAGIGKTWLAAAAAWSAMEAGGIVLYGRCEDQATVPFQAFVEAVRPLVPGVPDLPRHLIGVAPPAAASERYALFERFDLLLVARPEPITLVIDDAQWADPSGLQLLRYLLRATDRSSMLVIATTRPEGLAAAHPLAATLATVASAGHLETIRLAGLSLGEVEAMASGLGSASPERVRSVWSRTGGNPFFVQELLRRPADETSIALTARDAIVRRIAGLGPPVTEVLTAAAVAGERFRWDVVAASLGRDPGSNHSAIERAFGAGLVVASGGAGEYRFSHAIVRDALVEVTPPSRRAALHLAVAAVLERAGGQTTLPDIAHHRHAALPVGDPALACRAAMAAAAAAMDRYAYEVAATCASMALDALDAGGAEGVEEVERATVLLARGRAHLRAGDLQVACDDFTAALEFARRARDRRLAAQAVLAWSAAVPRWGRDPELRGALEAVLGERVRDRRLRAELRAHLARVLYFEEDHAERVRLARAAVADARAAGRSETLASVLDTVHVALWAPEDLADRIAVAEEIVSIARSSGHADLEASGLGCLIPDRLEEGDLEAVDRALRRHTALATRLRQRLLLRDGEAWRAMRAILDGRFETAASTIERARDLGEAAQDPAVEPMYWVQRFWLACERRVPAELDELVEPCERFARLYGHVPAWRAALAYLHACRGDQEAASEAYEPLAADGFAAIPRDFVWLNAFTYLAETCVYLDDKRRAALLHQSLLPYASRVVIIDRALGCKGSVARHVGLLAATMGNTAAASDHLDRALERHVVMGAGPLADRTRRELAVVLATRE